MHFLQKRVLLFFFLAVVYSTAFAQAQPKIDIPITITDDAGGTAVLRFGLDPNAGEGIDNALGENPLPPLPPAGVFDARFNLDNNESTLFDYRSGDSSFSGLKSYELQYQPGSGSIIRIVYDLPAGISCTFKDVLTGTVINKKVQLKGSYTIRSPFLYNKLKMNIEYSVISDVKHSDNAVPAGYALYQNYPNPFNPSTNIKFQIPEYSLVKLSVYDNLGRLAAELVNSPMDAGAYELNWNAENMSSGLYFLVLRAGNFSSARKMSIIK